MTGSESTCRRDRDTGSGLRQILESLQGDDDTWYEKLAPKDLETQYMSTLDACREAKMMVDMSYRSLGLDVYENPDGDHSRLVLEVEYAREIQSLMLKRLSRINKLRAR
ncbi:MAG: hypothetical protein L0H38_03750 [bacterium]|nr:hypothetical protein [bacterium]